MFLLLVNIVVLQIDRTAVQSIFSGDLLFYLCYGLHKGQEPSIFLLDQVSCLISDQSSGMTGLVQVYRV